VSRFFRRITLALLFVLPLTTITVAAGGQSAGGRIRILGARNSYQIVTIPIPDQLARSGDGFIEIIPNAGYTVLGVRKWPLASMVGKGKITSTIGIPANARAGSSAAAEVRFTVAGAPTTTITIDVEIPAVRELAVTMRPGPVRARVGGQTVLSYDLANTGDATETVETLVAAPSGWKSTQVSGSTAIVKPHESITRQLVVSIPRNSGTGSFFVRLDVMDGSVLRRSLPVTVEVLEGPSGLAHSGPLVTIGVAGAMDVSGAGSTVTTATVKGPLFDAVRIDARYAVGTAAVGPQAQALSRLGAYRATPSLTFSSPSGRLALGAAGASFSDLTGQYAYGKGAALDAHGSNWRLIGLGALSNGTQIVRPSQPIAGLRGDVDVGRVTVMSSVSHLRDGDLSTRQLDAAGLGASLNAGFATSISGEVALRRFAAGTGTGWSTEIARKDSRSSASVRATYAPGGSEAFARATNDLVASLSQSVTRRLAVSGSAWRASDATTSFAELGSSGWSFRPEYRIHSSTTIGLEARASDVTARLAGDHPDAASGYGGAERQAGVTINTSIRQLLVSGSAATGFVDRSVATTPDASQQFRSPKIWWNAMTSWRGSTTVVELQGRLEEELDLSGAVRRPSQVSFRTRQSFGAAFGNDGSADLEVQQIRGFSAAPTTVARGGIRLSVTELLALRLYAERNPLFTMSTGRSPWVYALRIEHSAHLPMLRVPTSTGYVFRDLNGNAKHDDGEPGFEGVVITRGDETAVTDASGRYRVPGDTRSPITLDETTLPAGWVRQTTGSHDIAIVSRLGAEIRFRVTSRSAIGEDAPNVDLTGIRVTARDSIGREWIGRMVGAGLAMFDALPGGTYRLDFDLSSLTEPLIPRSPVPTLHVTPLLENFVTVFLDPRPVRIWTAGSARGTPQ
jgi:hypothetical protein